MFMHGGVAPPGSSEDVPSIAGMVKRLSGDHDITVYTVIGPGGNRATFRCGRAIVTFVPSRHDDHIITMVHRTLRAFRRDHRVRPYSLVHGFWALPGGLIAVLAGRLHGLPSVVSMLGGEAACLPSIRYGNMSRLAPRIATLWTARHATTLTFLTRYQRDALRPFNFNRGEGIRVIPFGAENSLLRPNNERSVPPPYRFIHIGHLNSVKDQSTLLRAFRGISRQVDSHLTVIGLDTLHGALRRLAADLGIENRVTFKGFVPHEEIGHHLADAHMLLHSSLYEGEGVVFAEAAASGVPICGTRVGLLSDLGDAMAVTVSPGDHTGLAEGALSLLGDPMRTERLTRQARSWAQEHTADWTAASFADLYRRHES